MAKTNTSSKQFRKAPMLSKHAKISDSFPNLRLLLEDDSSYWKNEDHITVLPTEILEIILENLTYDEISKVREVSRRFRDVGNEILNRGFFRILPNCVHRMYSLLQVNELPDKALELYGLEKVVNGNERKTESEQLIILVNLCMLKEFMMQIKVINAICYRFIFSNDITPLICYSRSFFAGKIIDQILRILRLIKLKTVRNEDVKVYFDLVDGFINFFHDRIEPTLVVNEAVTNRRKLFGSKVVDLLDCCFYCKKNVNFFVDSEDWCHFKGEYKLHKSFFTGVLNQVEFENIQQLTVIQQRCLHESLRFFIKNRNRMINMRNYVLSANIIRPGSHRKPPSCGGLAVFGDDLFFYGCDDNEGGEVNENGNEETGDVTFKVEMKCRKELAPLDILSASSTGDEQCKVKGLTEDTDYDLVLRLEILCTAAAKENNRLSPVYRCLIKQKYLQEESLPNPDGPVEDVVIPLDRNSDTVIIRQNSDDET